MDVEQFRKEIRRVRTELLPSSIDIITETLQELNYTEDALKPANVRANFNSHLENTFKHSLKVLEKHEGRVYEKTLIHSLLSSSTDVIQRARKSMAAKGDDEAAFRETWVQIFQHFYHHIWRLFQSRSQSRKTRGGQDFENALKSLLDLAQVKYEAQVPGFRSDFMLPSLDMFRENKNVTLVVSVKRTLRERWQEVVDELHRLRSPNVYLATADDSISSKKQKEIAERNIYLLVWDHVKRQSFADEPLVAGFSEFIRETIPHFESRW